jgi:S1-C subfamily serine protease
MTRILILLASLLVVGCPQQSYRTQISEASSDLANPLPILPPDGHCILQEDNSLHKSAIDAFFSAEIGEPWLFISVRCEDLGHLETFARGLQKQTFPDAFHIVFGTVEKIDMFTKAEIKSFTPAEIGKQLMERVAGTFFVGEAWNDFSLDIDLADSKADALFDTITGSVEIRQVGVLGFDKNAFYVSGASGGKFKKGKQLAKEVVASTLVDDMHLRLAITSISGGQPPLSFKQLLRDVKRWTAITRGSPISTSESQPAPTPQPDRVRRLIGTGTGFVVNQNFVVTANHVLRATEDVYGPVCNDATILYKYKEYKTTIADLDIANDLGLLKLEESLTETAKLRNEPDLMVGEAAVNYGYPLTTVLSTSAKLNAGSVSSLAGYENNSAILQYDAATQRGNSGGPVLDSSGNVIGVVRSGLDEAKTQLVNFATKSTILEGFLKANKVPFEKADSTEKLELPDIAEKAEAFTVLVGCWE